MDKQKYIVRGDRSGVFYGEISRRDGSEVTMVNCRRIWYWAGANSISQLAQLGTTRPGDCNITVAVNEAVILDAIEINRCSDAAMAILDGVPEWIRQ